ncbi:DUF3298 and DUF4163 domain-containing protein [Geosporobacter ferrireducens]|uniref:DUF3298 and DUF4163 domain-containing protein n=1 Tax=Geosporobacter ferrireducens TaxID=1424294 RepID=UPI00139DDB18|nr:DUF3298 and DUF4163 domain-containing protein [Geosporobacter ferrireducens]MTI53483.1 DUF3298 and DUF4163 domain-containing protein [Geosporobacter ferrireducens]
MSFIKNPVQIITQRMVSSDQRLNIEYPVIVGMVDTAVQHQMNIAIRRLVNKIIIDQGYYQNYQTSVEGWYEIKNNQRGILSLNIINFAYTQGAAHGLTVIKSLTFDIQTGKVYTLEDLFKPGSDYVKVLSAIIRRQIKDRDIFLLDDFKDISSDQDFYIADKCLVIYYQLYELTAYAFGFPMFPISVYEIQDIIREDGPLGVMAVND